MWFLNRLCLFFASGILFWIFVVLYVINPNVVIDHIEKYILTKQEEGEYICNIEDIERCQLGDWMYVPLQQVVVYCHEKHLRGGILLNREVIPIFNGDEQPQNVLCVYRGTMRERR